MSTETRALTYREMWAGWEPLNEEELKKLQEASDELSDKLQKLSVGSGNETSVIDTSKPFFATPTEYPETRTTYLLTSEYQTLLARHHRSNRAKVYESVINLYSQDPKKARFKELWRDLHSAAVQSYGIEVRLSRAGEGKEAATKKYKEGNWLGAMYTYALAWGCIVPFHPEAFAMDDTTRNQVGVLECAFFSNVATMSSSAASDKQLTMDRKKAVLLLGIQACWIPITMTEYVSASIMKKCCNRILSLRKALTESHGVKFTSPRDKAEEAYLIKQDQAIPEKTTVQFKALPREKQIDLPHLVSAVKT